MTTTKLQLLVPLDGSDFSRRILPAVRRLFPPDRCVLRLLHVAVPPSGGTARPLYSPALVGPEYGLYTAGLGDPLAERHPLDDDDDDDLVDYRGALRRDLESEVAAFEREGYTVTTRVHFGDPAHEIVEFARESGVDAVAMATHNRSGLGRLLQGSVAQDAFRRLRIPTVLLHVEEETMDDRERPDHDERSRRERRDEERKPDPGAHTPHLAHPGAQPHYRDEVSPSPSGAATLDGVEGRGVLTVTRNDDGSVHQTVGTWEPGDSAALDAIDRAWHEGRTLSYEGPVAQGETADSAPAEGSERRQVRIVAIRRYTDDRERQRTLVSFAPVESDAEGGRGTAQQVPDDRYDRDDFARLPLARLEEITGLEPPAAGDARAEEDYREQAWKSYRLDIENRDEWGTARQDLPLPEGE